MITITLNANGIRNSVLASPDKTLGAFITEQKLNANVIPYLDGAPINESQKSKTFAELGITDACVISSVVKTNNAQ